jgi:drug/metabolite transporter (DMT)-like permease
MQERSFLRSNVFLALISCILWSTAFAGVKIGLQYTPPLQFAGIRFMISGLLILPFCRNLRQEMKAVLQNFRSVMIICLFQTVILYYFFYQGLNKTPAAIAAIIVGGGPLFIAFLAHFITGRDQLTLRKIAALCIGFSGIIMLALTKSSGVPDQKKMSLGIVMLIAGNFAGGYGNILVSENKLRISPVFLNAFQIFTGGMVLLIISFFTEDISFAIKPFPYYISLAWLSFLSAAAFTLWFIILSRPEVRVSEINVWKFIIPVVGAVLSWLLVTGEKPQWNTVSGMLLIASAILVIYGGRNKNSTHQSV